MSEQKKSVVKSVNPNGTFDGKYGLLYKYNVDMQNGDSGEYISNKYTSEQDKDFPFVSGQEVEYEYHGGKYPKIKQVQKNVGSFGGGKKAFSGRDERSMNRRTALMQAVKFYELQEDHIKRLDWSWDKRKSFLMSLARDFYKWLEDSPSIENKKVERKLDDDIPF